jgi:isoleucyl-tRNA synthetase
MNHMAEEQVKSTTPNFNELELKVLQFWEENHIFEKSLEQTKDGQPYIFYDGPPFATGLPHYGSILPSVIKDAIPRYQTMKGRYVRRRWGWDCHGLPIENLVEKNLKISGKKQIEEIGVDRFNKVCRENVLNLASEWGKMVKRIARWVDFENSYKTMDTTYMESVWAGLKQVWEKGLIYEDRKVLLYCSRCETPISNFEVAMDNSYRDVTEESVFAKFKLSPRQRIINDLTNDKTYALAWTTTPWTLPGNTSLNIGPDISYIMIEQNNERYILAKERLSVIDGEYEIVAEFPARALEGLEYEPLYPGVIPNPEGRAHKVYLADFVTTTDGTGIVHNAAMYGEEDYELAKAKNLPRVDMLDHKGQYLPTAPESLRGVFFKDAEKIVLQELRDRNLVYKTEHYTHSYPHCHRCGTPLFYNALSAWFINIQKVKPQLIEYNKTINWYPEHLKFGRFQQGIENAPDWNISRNRFWATALPFWKCENKECKHVECIGSIEELKDQSVNFSEVYPNYNPTDIQNLDLHKPYIDYIKMKCEKCGGAMSRVPEVVDCWVESGSMPFAELHAPFENVELFKQRFPSDFVVEYIPQTRAWFYVMHAMNTILFDQAPFKNVLTTGTILGDDGTKMSKSKGNYPDPNIVVEQYGADALRFYFLTSPVLSGEDVNFSEKAVADISRKVNMITYNVWSFYRMYRSAELKTKERRPASSHVLDKWILDMLSDTHGKVTGYMDTYDVARAGKLLVDFVQELSTWYVRRSRDRMKESGEQGQQALDTLGYALVEFSKMLAPFMPFLADFLYKDLTGKESVHLALWSSEMPAPDTTVIANMEFSRQLVEAGLSIRKEQNLKVRQPLSSLVYKQKENISLTEDFHTIIAQELNVKKVFGQSDVAAAVGLVVKEISEGSVGLDVVLTDELKKEGLARELERVVQDLRKKSELKVGELVDVYYNTTDEGLEEILLSLFDRKKTFVNQINKSFEVEVDFETQGDVSGKAIWIGMIKV